MPSGLVQLALAVLDTRLSPHEKFVLAPGAFPVPLFTPQKVLHTTFRLFVENNLLYQNFNVLSPMSHFEPNGRILNHPQKHQ